MTTCCGCRTTASTSPTPASATWPPRRWSATTSWSAACSRPHGLVGRGDPRRRQRPRLRRERHRHGRRPRALPTTSSSSRRWTIPSSATTCTTQYPGTIVANVGEKGYQVESMAASSSDYWVRMGSKKKTADLADPERSCPWTGKYRGAGGNRARLHRERPPLQGQRRQRPLDGDPRRCRTTTTAPRPTSRPGGILRTAATSPVRTRPRSGYT